MTLKMMCQKLMKAAFTIVSTMSIKQP